MSKARWLLPATAFLSAACATAPAPRPLAPGPRPQASGTVAEAAEYRRELEQAYAEIIQVEDPDKRGRLSSTAASIEIPEHRAIQNALTYFTTGLRDSIQTSLLRSGRYRNLIDKALADRGLPKGLAYLPVIESAYMTSLTSRAGAHGLWQFMPDTAREYGLRVDWWVDERADPVRSTVAAAEYLEDLYRQFNDWPLTLAAYNAGPGRISRAMSRTGARNFWELLDMAAIPKETRGYVPTFFATLQIANDPESFGFTLGAPEETDETEIAIEGPVSLRYLAEVTSVDESALQILNPAFRRGIVPPGRATLRVPSRVAETIADRAPTLRNEDPNIAVCNFTLRKGDTILELARAIGTDPSTIVEMNDLQSPSRLRTGDSIYLPVRARELGPLLSHWKDKKYFYAVRKGDTIYSIAKRHNLTVSELRDLNELQKTSALQPGQKLRVAPPRVITAGGM